MFNASNNNNENNSREVRVLKERRIGRDVLSWGLIWRYTGNKRVRFWSWKWSWVGGKIKGDYYLYWIRDKLRKIENGEIVVRGSAGERDWREEERIKKEMWEDINVNEAPKALSFDNPFNHYCPQQTPTTVTTVSAQQVYRPPSPPCRIS